MSPVAPFTLRDKSDQSTTDAIAAETPGVNKIVELLFCTSHPCPLPFPHLSGLRNVEVFLSNEAAAGLVGGER